MSVNEIRFRPVSVVKKMLLRSGRKPRKVRLGLFRNLTLNLDMRSDAQVLFGLWERETYSRIRKAAHGCQWMVDVGSGKGELCVFFARHSSAQKVVCIDPDAGEIERMLYNLELNGESDSQKVSVLKKFVGTSRDSQFVELDGLQLGQGEKGFVKIDVEGAELDVLKSGTRLLKNRNVDLVIETHSSQLESDCVGLLEGHGYDCQILPNAWWRLVIPEGRPAAHNRWLWASNQKSFINNKATAEPLPLKRAA
jgi:Methyltransferase FkbM domain